MKNQNRFDRGARLLALLLSALLLLGIFPMGALAGLEEKGSLLVRLKEDTYANLPKTPAVAVTLYQIGEAAPDVKAGWRIFEAFSGYGVLNAREESALGVIAAKMGEDIVGKDGFSGTEKTLQNGQVLFSDLDQGVYLGVLTEGPEGLEVDPFIVTVPAKDPKGTDLLLDYPVTLKDRCVTEATVRKEWDDKDNQDGIRPENLAVTLSDGESIIQTVKLNVFNGWQYTVSNLPRYKGGKAIAYTWTEEALPKGYELTGTATEGVVTTLTNRHVPETTSVTVRKEWDDKNDQDNIRPASLTVKLSDGQSVVLNEANGWTATIDNLPKYKNGVKIDYKWTEEGLPEGYELYYTDTWGTVTTLTNRHAPETVSATVRKVWDDNDNQDGIRPEELEVLLNNRYYVKLNEDNKWEATLDKLPKYDKGVEISYSWSEKELPEGYELTGTAVDGAITTLTNSHTPQTTTATVRKVWDDDGNRDGIRPASLTVALMNGSTTVGTVTLNGTNNWTATLDNLPKFDKGVEIAYSWAEMNLPEGYTLTDTQKNGKVTTLTNTHVPERTSATVRKVWDDDNDRDRVRPESLTVRLLGAGTVTLNEANDWTATIDDLPKYQNGKEIVFTWIEEDLPEGYELTSTDREGTITTLTNTHIPEKVSATVSKEWYDDDDRDGKRPYRLVMTLSNGQSVTLDESNGWKATIEDLPKYEDGKEIVYTWTEETMPEGYTLEATYSEHEDGFYTTFVNRHWSEEVSVGVHKVWDDDFDRDGVRPESLDVTLVRDDGVVISKVTLNKANDWKAVLYLPKYDKGKVHTYSWVEDLPEGYSMMSAMEYTNEEYIYNPSDSNLNSYGFKLTNTHSPETISLTVRKIWQDEDNVDRIRPARLRVTLWGDDKEVDVVTLSAANNWEATVDNLPKYRDGGKEIAYTWAEEATVDYMLRLPVVEGNITTLTNVHTPNVKLTEVSGQKIWDDNHNEHKVRPANITITLYADGAPVNAAPVWRSKQGDSWSYVFSGLPAENAAGATINYTVDETPVEYYSTEISDTTITNSLIPRQPQEYKEIKGVKRWEDDENRGGTRPDFVTVHLMRDSVEIASVKITEATGWSYSFGRQPVDDGYGHIYNYEVREDGVPGYFCRVEGMNLINKLLYTRPDTPNITTTRRQVGSQYTATGRPPFERYTAEELEDMLYDVPLYGTPLWGGLLGTGDITPLYPFIFGGIGVIAVIVLVLIGRKRKKGSK